ncbi:hypothetical protein CLAVI_000920 [Candidatus Clavichlamydia salmonicola]|uniref:hypothetical protein n=1 Tax=Candidatus Clavichlamydia salmonicola TaxID=469812 RepID=UPI001890E0FF|nr:hypothetical protein [Candidatus Clavichlamydia salmonicola]MBF5051279.1 hypothetical protein [Candidatus Clavichlamydia salmonicola]
MSSIQCNNNNPSLTSVLPKTNCLKKSSYAKTLFILIQVVSAALLLISSILCGLSLIGLEVGLGLIGGLVGILAINTFIFFLPNIKMTITNKKQLLDEQRFNSFQTIYKAIRTQQQEKENIYQNKHQALLLVENTITTDSNSLKTSINKLSLEIDAEIYLLTDKREYLKQKNSDVQSLILNTSTNIGNLKKELMVINQQDNALKSKALSNTLEDLNTLQEIFSNLEKESIEIQKLDKQLIQAANYVETRKYAYSQLLLAFDQYSQALDIITKQKASLKVFLDDLSNISTHLNILALPSELDTVTKEQYNRLLKLEKFASAIFLTQNDQDSLLETPVITLKFEKLKSDFNL